MHRISRDEHEITRLDSPGLIAYSEPALAFQDQHELVMIRLDVNNVFTLFENVDIARDVLAVTQERPLYGVAGGCGVGREATIIWSAGSP